MSPATDVGGGRRSIVPLLVATVFLDLVGFGIVVPQLPLAAARFEDRGLIVGLLVATDSLLSFFLAPQWGRLSDRIGRRPVILIGLAASAVSYAMFGLAPSLAILFLSRIISGGFGATVNVSQAFLADVTPGARRSQAMGFVGAAFGVGFTIGPIIGGLAARSSVAAPGLVAAAICGINFLLALVFLPESRERATREWSRSGSVPRQAALIAFGVSLAFTTVYVVFQRFARDELGLSRSAISYCFAVLGLVTAIVQGRLVGKLVPRVGERRLIMWGATLVAAGLLTILGSRARPGLGGDRHARGGRVAAQRRLQPGGAVRRRHRVPHDVGRRAGARARRAAERGDGGADHGAAAARLPERARRVRGGLRNGDGRGDCRGRGGATVEGAYRGTLKIRRHRMSVKNGSGR